MGNIIEFKEHRKERKESDTQKKQNEGTFSFTKFWATYDSWLDKQSNHTHYSPEFFKI